ncbi:hypothetical protein SPRG_07848 [Saprolegnia parasitica CBS 223.65]|uniref:Uncharacterized protein n=1 Tax=Saprolegnia parasitica (strain CBS 223.65) TaxID=695850 RepID=A0A067CD91_SAPPC|nr:hypothetical protein SPRG_07848 [Saprolegnia parasitica CBS 223.65]KDO27140.1 hypothetical protein SPRG_07848 [Saprolegnia parasitica CBS 223.65]|eukprot:XP_012202230.1 hypothetical protein SPRG_07848 [Saprolegnia parasitica CBS 223.65]
MGVHYAKRKESVLEKVGLRTEYVAIDVDDGTMTWLNSQRTFALTDIVAASWTQDRLVKLRIETLDDSSSSSSSSFRFQFDDDHDLDAFMADVGIHASSPSRGSFSTRRRSSCGRQSLLALLSSKS